MAKKGGLGRGLGALIPGADVIEAAAPGVARLSVDDIRPNPDQPRRGFDEAELRALADSVRQHGILQPLVVARDDSGYRLIAGERRLRAARLAGLSEVPVVVRADPPAEDSLQLSLIENLQRQDLNPIEEAEAYRRLIDDFQLTQESVGRQVGKSRAHVTNSLRLLALAPAVQGALLAGAVSAGHARALASLAVEAQEDALRRVLREDLNVRQTEAMVRVGPPRQRRSHARSTTGPDPDTAELEKRFREALQAKVSLTRRRGGRGGRLVIEFFSDDELDGLFRAIVLGQRAG